MEESSQKLLKDFQKSKVFADLSEVLLQVRTRHGFGESVAGFQIVGCASKAWRIGGLL